MTREKDIERKVCAYARRRYGMLTPKLASPSNAGMPDRMFITLEGLIAFIEFKAPGEEPTALQHRQLTSLLEHCCEVFVVDDADKGATLVDALSDAELYKGLLYGFDPAEGEAPPAQLVIPSHVSEARRRALMEEPEGDALDGHGLGEDDSHPHKPH